MSLIFIFNNINTFFLVLWGCVAVLVALRYFRPTLVKNISYRWIVALAIFIHLFYGAFVTWGQYYVWAGGNDFTRSLLHAPLSKEAPLPAFLEWSRSSFEQPLGYFVYYVFGRIWLNIIFVFITSVFFYIIFKLWSNYRGGFLPHGPELIFALLLATGFPGCLILVPLAFTLSFIWFGITFLKKRSMEGVEIHIEPAFIVVAPIVLLFGKIIRSFF